MPEKSYRSTVIVPFKSQAKLQGEFTITEALDVLSFGNKGPHLKAVENLFQQASCFQATLAFMNCQGGNLCMLFSFPTRKKREEFHNSLVQMMPNVAFG